jgi:predicted Zn-dependent protease
VAAAQPPAAAGAGEQLEADVSAIEYLARVGPSRYGVPDTLTRLRAAAAAARERYAAATSSEGDAR